MDNVKYDRELKQAFNNSAYYVRALSKDKTLYVEVEQENTGYKWRNQFIDSYIEEMTTKTGNFKTFDRFCTMMYSALHRNNNGSVFIDLLSYQDLEILKARKATKSGIEAQPLNATQRTKNKRYLILTYVVEFDRVHYPLALKLDENSIDTQSIDSSLTSSPKLTPNIMERKQKKQYPSDKLTDIIKVLEDEIKILKTELEKKNFEIRRITRNTKQFQQKHISKRLDDLEDEIERLSTELLSERTKYRRINREFHTERCELQKKIEILEASNDHYKRKCRSLKDEANATKQTLENLRIKASKQRLYSSSSTSLRRSRSRNNKNNNNNKYNNNKYNKYNVSKRHKYNNNNKNIRYQRSSSAPRFQNKRNYQSRSRSPSVRFDPTLWAKQRKEKIEKSKLMRNTFGKSRSPSPFDTSRSVTSISSEKYGYHRNRSKNRKNNKKKKNNKKNIGKRERSNSRKRNSFGTTISRSPKSPKSTRLPLHPSKYENYENHENDENENDLNILNAMKKRQKRILSMNTMDDTEDDDDDDDDDDTESMFNPTKEIESIDSRLNALQKFLRAAKSSS